MANALEVEAAAQRAGDQVNVILGGEPELRFMLFVFPADGRSAVITGNAPFEFSMLVATKAMQMKMSALLDERVHVLS